jgi:hypothetical protein
LSFFFVLKKRYYLTSKNYLWKDVEIKETFFEHFMDSEQIKILFQDLKNENILNSQNKLTSKFLPHLENFELKLSEDLKKFQLEILKILISNGPAFPHRVV